MALSKLVMILMASWGSIRRLLMRSSNVSASVPPMLYNSFSAQCWMVMSWLRIPRIAVHLMVHAILSHLGRRLLCNVRIAEE
jgi:hypothetical protein